MKVTDMKSYCENPMEVLEAIGGDSPCYYQLGKRKFWIRGEISEQLIDMAMDILRINKKDKEKAPCERKPIIIYISSNGGDLDSMLVLRDVIEASETPITTVGIGTCFSAAAILLMSGHYRVALPSCDIMVHDASVGYPDMKPRTSLNSSHNYYNLKFDMLMDWIVDNSNLTMDELEEKYYKDYFMGAEEALEKGLIDEIVSSVDMMY